MAQMARSFRYSPLNGIVVDWSFNGRHFDSSCLPRGLCAEDPYTPDEVLCKPLPIQEAIDTYDWARWLPEVMVGVDDPNEDIAAAYVREVAIDFTRYTKVLRRNVFVQICSEEQVYPVYPYIGERIEGVIRARTLTGQACSCGGGTAGSFKTFDFTFDKARNEITIYGDMCGTDVLQLEVWASPTEDACAQDVELYNGHRSTIAEEARRRYITKYHFNDAGALRSLADRQQFEIDKITAARNAVQRPANRRGTQTSGLWGGTTARYDPRSRYPEDGPYKGW